MVHENPKKVDLNEEQQFLIFFHEVEELREHSELRNGRYSIRKRTVNLFMPERERLRGREGGRGEREVKEQTKGRVLGDLKRERESITLLEGSLASPSRHEKVKKR
jgi:hypothetical protein